MKQRTYIDCLVASRHADRAFHHPRSFFIHFPIFPWPPFEYDMADVPILIELFSMVLGGGWG